MSIMTPALDKSASRMQAAYRHPLTQWDVGFPSASSAAPVAVPQQIMASTWPMQLYEPSERSRRQRRRLNHAPADDASKGQNLQYQYPIPVNLFSSGQRKVIHQSRPSARRQPSQQRQGEREAGGRPKQPHEPADGPAAGRTDLMWQLVTFCHRVRCQRDAAAIRKKDRAAGGALAMSTQHGDARHGSAPQTDPHHEALASAKVCRRLEQFFVRAISIDVRSGHAAPRTSACHEATPEIGSAAKSRWDVVVGVPEHELLFRLTENEWALVLNVAADAKWQPTLAAAAALLRLLADDLAIHDKRGCPPEQSGDEDAVTAPRESYLRLTLELGRLLACQRRLPPSPLGDRRNRQWSESATQMLDAGRIGSLIDGVSSAIVGGSGNGDAAGCGLLSLDGRVLLECLLLRSLPVAVTVATALEPADGAADAARDFLAWVTGARDAGGLYGLESGLGVSLSTGTAGSETLPDQPYLLRAPAWCQLAAALAKAYQQHRQPAAVVGATAERLLPVAGLLPAPGEAWLRAFMQGSACAPVRRTGRSSGWDAKPDGRADAMAGRNCGREDDPVDWGSAAPSLQQLAEALRALQLLYPSGKWYSGAVDGAGGCLGGGSFGGGGDPGVIAGARASGGITPPDAAGSQLQKWQQLQGAGLAVQQQRSREQWQHQQQEDRLPRQQRQRLPEAWMSRWWRSTAVAASAVAADGDVDSKGIEGLVRLLEVIDASIVEAEGRRKKRMKKKMWPLLQPPTFWRSAVAAAVERCLLALDGSGTRGDRAERAVDGASGRRAENSVEGASSSARGTARATGAGSVCSGVPNFRNCVALLRSYYALGLHRGRSVHDLARCVLQYTLHTYGGSSGGDLAAMLPVEDLAALLKWHRLYGSPMPDAEGVVQALLCHPAPPLAPALLPLPLLADVMSGLSTSTRPLPLHWATRLATWIEAHLDNPSPLGSTNHSSNSGSNGGGSSTSSGGTSTSSIISHNSADGSSSGTSARGSSSVNDDLGGDLPAPFCKVDDGRGDGYLTDQVVAASQGGAALSESLVGFVEDGTLVRAPAKPAAASLSGVVGASSSLLPPPRLQRPEKMTAPLQLLKGEAARNRAQSMELPLLVQPARSCRSPPTEISNPSHNHHQHNIRQQHQQQEKQDSEQQQQIRVVSHSCPPRPQAQQQQGEVDPTHVDTAAGHMPAQGANRWQEVEQSGRSPSQKQPDAGRSELQVLLELFVSCAMLAARHAPASGVSVWRGGGVAAAEEETVEEKTGVLSAEAAVVEAATAPGCMAAAAGRGLPGAGAAGSAVAQNGLEELYEVDENEVEQLQEVEAAAQNINPFQAALEAFLPALRIRLATASASELQKAARKLLGARRVYDPPSPSPSPTTTSMPPPSSPTTSAWRLLEVCLEPLLESSGCGHMPPGPLLQLLVDVSFASANQLTPGFRSQLLHAISLEVDRTAFLLMANMQGERQRAVPPGRQAGPDQRSMSRATTPPLPVAVTPSSALSPNEVSHAVAAVARLMPGQQLTCPSVVVRRLARCVVMAVPQMAPPELVQGVWALAELGAVAPQFIPPEGADMLLRVLRHRLAAIPTQSLPLLLWSLARIRLRPASRWMVSYTKIIQAHIREYDMRQVAQLVWAYGQLTPAAPYSKLYHRPPRRLVIYLLRRSLRAMRAEGGCVIPARATSPWVRSSASPSPMEDRSSLESSPSSSSSWVSGLQSESVAVSPVVAAVGRRGGGGGGGVSWHYRHLRPEDSAMLVSGMAGLEARPGDIWLRALWAWAGPRLAYFSARDLALLLFGLGGLEARPPRMWVGRAGRCMSSQLPFATGLDAAHAAAGLARLATGLVPRSAVTAFRDAVPRLLRPGAHPLKFPTSVHHHHPGDRHRRDAGRGGNLDGANSLYMDGGDDKAAAPDQRPGEERSQEAWAGFLRSAYAQLRDNARPATHRDQRRRRQLRSQRRQRLQRIRGQMG